MDRTKKKPYPKRGWLMTWLRLPFDLMGIRLMRPADAVELVRYLELRGGKRLQSRPMRLIVAALHRRAAEPL